MLFPAILIPKGATTFAKAGSIAPGCYQFIVLVVARAVLLKYKIVHVFF